MKLEEFYRQAGGSYEDVHARFQSDERVLRFLRLFAGDDSMDSLTAAVPVFACLLLLVFRTI